MKHHERNIYRKNNHYLKTNIEQAYDSLTISQKDKTICQDSMGEYFSSQRRSPTLSEA